jgi:hypothetical protein
LVLKKEPSSLQKKGSNSTNINSGNNEAKSNNGDADDKSSNIKTHNSESQSYIEKFSAFRITVSSLQFKSQKQIMLNFESTTNLKGKY